MRNIYLSFASVILLLILLSCGQDSTNEIEVGKEVNDRNKKEVIINAYFYNITGNGSITTRATDNAWEVGDFIGLFMKKAEIDLTQSALAKNVKLTTDGTNRFTYLQDQKVYFPFNKEKVDFISYHPYSSALDGLYYMIDVSDQTNLSAIDLMYSHNAKNKNSEIKIVDLNFEHQLTKVVFTIDVNNSGKNLSNISAKITNVNTKANFSLIDGIITNKDTPKDVTLNVDNLGTVLQAILLPDNDLSNKNLIIDIDGTTYTYPLKSATTIKAFEKSKLCAYNIILNAGQGPIIESVNATITDWITVSEDIIITEDPLETSPEENNPKPDEGDDAGSPDGDGDSNTIPPEEGGDTGTPKEPNEEQTNPIIEDGDGTQENPYNITQAFQLVEDRDKKIENHIPIVKDVWIKGYIVGYYSDITFLKFVNSVDKASESSLALALTTEEADHHNIFRVNLLKSSNIRPVNLKNKPEHFKKEVIFKGNIIYLSGPSEDPKYGLSNLKVAIIDGVTYTQIK